MWSSNVEIKIKGPVFSTGVFTSWLSRTLLWLKVDGAMPRMNPCTDKNYKGVTSKKDVNQTQSAHSHTHSWEEFIIQNNWNQLCGCTIGGTVYLKAELRCMVTGEWTTLRMKQTSCFKRVALLFVVCKCLIQQKWQINSRIERDIWLYLVRRDWQERSNGSQHCSWQHIHISLGRTPRCSQFAELLCRGLKM